MKWITGIVLLLSMHSLNVSTPFQLRAQEGLIKTEFSYLVGEKELKNIESEDTALNDEKELFSLSSTHLSVKENESVYFEITLLDSSIKNPEYEISYSQPEIAQVNLKNKQIMGLNIGTVTVTIKLLGQSKTLTVNVTGNKATISFTEDKFYLIRGLSYNIPYTVLPSNLSQKPITWSSSNTSVAGVENGRVVGNNIGKTIITATVDGSIARLELYVTAPLQEISFTTDSMSLGVGETSLPISVITKPTDTTDSFELQFKIEDESVIKLTDDYEVVGLKEGKTKITASAKSFSTSMEVTVKKLENDRGLIEINMDEKRTGSSQIQYSMDKTIVEKNKKYSVILPDTSINSLLAEKDEISVVVFVDQALLNGNFKQLEELIVPKSILKNMNNKKMFVTLKNNYGVTYVRYTLTHASSSDLDLRYKLTDFYKGSTLGNLVSTNGYQLSLMNAGMFPLNTILSFPASTLGARAGINRYLYFYDRNTSSFEYTEQAMAPNDSMMIDFSIEKNDYLITDTKVSMRNNTDIYTVFAGVAIVVGATVGFVYYKDRKKTKIS